MFRKAVNVTDQIPLVSALSGETFLLDFDHVLNYHFSDPFNDVAFVQVVLLQLLLLLLVLLLSSILKFPIFSL